MSEISFLSRPEVITHCYVSKGGDPRQSKATLAIVSKANLSGINFFLFAILSFCASLSVALTEPTFKTETLAQELKSPWSMVQTPNGTWLITERDGHVVIANGNEQKRVKLELESLYVAGQGGLLDIVLTPDFEQSREVLFTFSQGKLEANRLVIAKAKFDGQSFSKPTAIFKVSPDKGTPQHYAGRALVLPDNTLLFSSGDGFDYREQAQVKSNQLGKVLRINLDGSIPKDNPFIGEQDKNAHAVFSIGHRNTQGLIYDSDNKRIVSHEHGPAGGDELNFLEAGKNYGWPVITLGKDYSRANISPFKEYKGMENPLVNWTPSIAPSGMAYYSKSHNVFPSLQGHALVTTLVDQKLYAVNLSNNEFDQQHIFKDVSGRLRDVVVTNTGEVAVLTDGKSASLVLLKSAN